MHSRRVLPFFFAIRTRAPHGEVLGLMNPLSSSSCSWTLSSYNSTGAILCEVIEMVEMPGCNSIPKSTSLCGGSPGSSSGKTSTYSHTTRGRSKYNFLRQSESTHFSRHRGSGAVNRFSMRRKAQIACTHVP